MKFKEFLESHEMISVETLDEFAETVGGGMAMRPDEIDYDGTLYSWNGRTNSGFDVNSQQVTYYAKHGGANNNVSVIWLRGKRPCFIVRSQLEETPPFEIEVLNDADFVRAALGSTEDKEKTIKILLAKYREVVDADSEHGTFWFGLEDSKMFLSALLHSLEKVHNWPELKAIQKSMSASKSLD